MIILKLYYHILCWIKIFCYKIIYGKAFSVPIDISFRKGFHIVIEDTGRINISHHVFFNNYCTIASRTLVTIGEGAIFGENVKIYDHNHCYKDLTLPIKVQGYTSAPITIGKHCWIASNVVILKGVTIGDNCVIGTGCIVYKDVPANTILINKQELVERKYKECE